MTKIRQKHLKTSQYSLRQEVKAFFAYFENIWIGQNLSRGRRQPMFAYSLWNKHSDMVADNFHLTNNSLEAMNSSWAPNVPRSATIWTIVHRFQKEEMLAGRLPLLRRVGCSQSCADQQALVPCLNCSTAPSL